MPINPKYFVMLKQFIEQYRNVDFIDDRKGTQVFMMERRRRSQRLAVVAQSARLNLPASKTENYFLPNDKTAVKSSPSTELKKGRGRVVAGSVVARTILKEKEKEGEKEGVKVKEVTVKESKDRRVGNTTSRLKGTQSQPRQLKRKLGQRLDAPQAKKLKARWVPPQPWVAHPHQVTVEQCCQYLQLRDYPILVNQTLKERFKDKRRFDEYATPLLRIANPRAHPLILHTLLRAKWFEAMNMISGLCYSQPPYKSYSK